MRNLIKLPFSVALVALAIAITATVAAAVSLVTTDDVTDGGLVPTSLVYQAETSGDIQVFTENIGITSTGPVAADIGGPIPAGTYDSYIIHFDVGGGLANAKGSVTFPGVIVGVMHQNGTLLNSDDDFGASGTNYVTRARRLELGTGTYSDEITVIGNTVTVDLWVAGAIDQVRVITAAMPTATSDCKKGGWEDYGVFKNQGDCVSFVATDGKNQPSGG